MKLDRIDHTSLGGSSSQLNFIEYRDLFIADPFLYGVVEIVKMRRIEMGIE